MLIIRQMVDQKPTCVSLHVHVAEASVGQYWTVEGETMVLEVSNLVKTFMNATGMRIPPHVIRQCWPMLCEEETPQQELGGIHGLLCANWMK